MAPFCGLGRVRSAIVRESSNSKWILMSRPEVRLGPGDLLRLRIADQNLITTRFTHEQGGFVLLPEGSGADIDLTLELAFPFLRGEENAPESFLISTINHELNAASRGTGAAPTADDRSLSYRFGIRVAGDWVTDSNHEAFVISRKKNGRWDWKVLLERAQAGKWGTSLLENVARRFELSGMQWDLRPLFGDEYGNVQVELSTASSSATLSAIENGEIKIPLRLSLTLAKSAIEFDLDVPINLEHCRIDKGKAVNFRFAAGLGTPCQIVDFGIFANLFPTRNVGDESNDPDSTIDFAKRELMIFARPDVPTPVMYFPGNLRNGSASSRARLKFMPFDRTNYPEITVDNLLFRINRQGVTLRAVIDPQHSPTIYRGPGKPIALQPQTERKGISSEIVIIDNVFRALSIFADMDAPGCDDLVVHAELMVRQERGSAPTVDAMVAIERKGEKPIANLSVGYLKFFLEELKAKLKMANGNRRLGSYRSGRRQPGAIEQDHRHWQPG
jgi:hypothetical protein